MKRTLLGMLVMGSLVGLGSFGVYYAGQRLAPPEVAAEAETAAPDEAPDRTPVPIPVANQSQGAPIEAYDAPQDAQNEMPAAAPGAANPFVGGGNRAYDDVAADNYPSAGDAAAPIGEPAGVEPRRIDNYGQDYAAEEIPDANQVGGYDVPQGAAAASDPYAADPAYNESRFAEQPVAAEMPAEAEPTPAADPYDAAPAAGGEPRRLNGGPAPAAADPYASQPSGNPLRGGASSRYNQQATEPIEPQTAVPQAADGRYAADEFPDASEIAPRAMPEPASQPEPALAGEADAFANRGASEGTGRPGDPQLNGAQAPALLIEKTAPPEIQIGKPAKFTIKVTNAGNVAADGVEIHDVIPRGTQLLDTVPPAEQGADGQVIWAVGTLKPSEERSVEMQLMPTEEGEIGSVATVHFRAAASVRTLATKPMLDLEVFGPSKVHKGEQVVLHVKLSNPGSGAATGVMLSEAVPEGLAHEAGRELEVEVGTLEPGGSRELDLALLAAEAGEVVNVVTAKGDGKLAAEARTDIEVVAPKLEVAMSGPKRRYLERNATHNISISNPGTAPAKNIDLVAVLPRTLKFVEANNGGQFDEATHAVYWNLEELPPQQTGTVKLTTLPLEPGEARLLIKSSSQDGLKDEREEVVAIEGLAAINFQLSDVKDPVEIGGETAYEIRVTNQGTKAATNVRLGALLPQGMQPLAADGPVRHNIEGQHVLFEPLKQLAPKADMTFTIRAKAVAVGDQRLQVQVATDEFRDPVTKEESTRVYGDE